MYTGPFSFGDIIGGHGRAIIIIQWIGFLITAVLVGLRAAFPGATGGKWRWDFIWVGMSLAFMLAFNVLSLFAVSNGLGNHIQNFRSYADIVGVSYWLTWTIAFAFVGVTMAKYSTIALLLNGLGSHLPSRVALWIVASIITLINILTFCFLLFQCQPISKAWDLLAEGTCNYRDVVQILIYVNSAISGVSDLILSLWPIVIVWRMTMNRRSKFVFAGLMVVMALSAVPAFVRIHLTKDLILDPDPTYALGVLMICISVEAWLVAILPSVVILRHVWQRLFSRASTMFRTSADRSATRSQPGIMSAGTYDRTSAGPEEVTTCTDGPKDSVTKDTKDMMFVQRVTIT